MNRVRAYLFQCVKYPQDVKMVWENADITKCFDDVNEGDLRYIGWVTYDTEEHRVTE